VKQEPLAFVGEFLPIRADRNNVSRSVWQEVPSFDFLYMLFLCAVKPDEKENQRCDNADSNEKAETISHTIIRLTHTTKIAVCAWMSIRSVIELFNTDATMHSMGRKKFGIHGSTGLVGITGIQGHTSIQGHVGSAPHLDYWCRLGDTEKALKGLDSYYKSMLNWYDAKAKHNPTKEKYWLDCKERFISTNFYEQAMDFFRDLIIQAKTARALDGGFGPSYFPNSEL
jgi:hypothetical protein